MSEWLMLLCNAFRPLDVPLSGLFVGLIEAKILKYKILVFFSIGAFFIGLVDPPFKESIDNALMS